MAEFEGVAAAFSGAKQDLAEAFANLNESAGKKLRSFSLLRSDVLCPTFIRRLVGRTIRLQDIEISWRHLMSRLTCFLATSYKYDTLCKSLLRFQLDMWYFKSAILSGKPKIFPMFCLGLRMFYVRIFFPLTNIKVVYFILLNSLRSKIFCLTVVCIEITGWETKHQFPRYFCFNSKQLTQVWDKNRIPNLYHNCVTNSRTNVRTLTNYVGKNSGKFLSGIV